MNKPEPGMMFGYCLLILMTFLAGCIALGKVEEKTSYGLHDVLIILASIAGGWTNWAFGRSRNDEKNGPHQ